MKQIIILLIILLLFQPTKSSAQIEEEMLPEDSIVNETNENADNNQDQKQDQKQEDQKQNDDLLENNQKYVFGSIDIPLFENITILSEESTDFDSMSGNITISTYKGKIDINKLRDFYLETLPQLGWKLSNDDGKTLFFQRDKDILKITSYPANKTIKNSDILVKFFISINNE